MKDFVNRHFRRRARAFRDIGAAFEVQRAELDHLKVRLAELTGTTEAVLRELRSVEVLARAAIDDITAARGDIAALRDEAPGWADAHDARLRRILFDVRSRHAESRERLFALRRTPAYERAYTDEEPLVSVLIPTFDRLGPLLERALPSVLAQTHSRIEVLVVGDGSPPHVADAIHSLDDPRVHYVHQTVNGPYPLDPQARWYTKGSPGINAGLLSARGDWICFFADDDVLHPEAIRTTLDAARKRRLELCYGKVRLFLANGRVEELGAFPPSLGGQGLQGAVLHAGLRFLQHELGDGDMEVANDWSFVNRALHIGAHVGMVDEVIADWFDVGMAPAGEDASRWTHDA